MGNKAVSKEARRAAREAAAAAQEEVLRRTRANVEDLAAFFDARDRADAVDAWLAERQQALAEQAAQRRAGHRLACGTALRSMRDRGESLRKIARMAGISEKSARELIRDAESAHADQGAADVAEGVDAAAPVRSAPESLAAAEPGGFEGVAAERAVEPVAARI
ncbi:MULTISPECIES: hypothetical protein [unclassified Mycobacterium]|uniref:hypothetical protein n=1 Tax=unclassified Mycobacterium TaxID=2642494 RepID=UPI0007FC7D0D|nr:MULTISPECIES: hypothetical protein [unclassified Mycobacterium]OBG71228.1 hypothetical protein A5700_12390 [Mycobacterium sp. E1214]OBH30403.1 hypothetical protein A5693_18070 [Mycobacterium sp. E1319]